MRPSSRLDALNDARGREWSLRGSAVVPSLEDALKLCRSQRIVRAKPEILDECRGRLKQEALGSSAICGLFPRASSTKGMGLAQGGGELIVGAETETVCGTELRKQRLCCRISG